MAQVADFSVLEGSLLLFTKYPLYGRCILLFCISKAALAEPCPTLPIIDLQLTEAQWRGIEQELLPLQNQCLRNSLYYSVLGAAQLNTGQHEEALLSLERALLLDENNGAALVDYTQALLNTGQLFAALDLNEQLLKRPDLPPELADYLRTRGDTWQQLTRRQETNISWRAGYSDNLNGAPDLDVLQVTLGDQQGTLELSESSKSISGWQQRVQLDHSYQWAGAESAQELSFALNSRVSQDRNSDRQQVIIGYRHRQHLESGKLIWNANIDYNHFGGNPLYSDNEIGIRYEYERHACQPLIQASATYRHFYRDDELDANLLQVGGGVSCHLGNNKINVVLEHTRNWELRHRAGGDSRNIEMRIQWQRPLAGGFINGALRYGRNDDSEGYSELLNNNAKRYIRQKYLDLAYLKPLSDDLEGSISFNYTQYDSNLALFSQRRIQLLFGVRYRF